jgi:hypothetical protein
MIHTAIGSWLIMSWSIFGEMEVDSQIDPESFILGAILGFFCSLVILTPVVLIIWLVRKSRTSDH